MRTRRLGVVVAACFVLAACGGETGGSPEPADLSAADQRVCDAQVRDLKKVRDVLSADESPVLDVLAATDGAVSTLVDYEADDPELVQLLADAANEVAAVNIAAQGEPTYGSLTAADLERPASVLADLGSWCSGRD